MTKLFLPGCLVLVILIAVFTYEELPSVQRDPDAGKPRAAYLMAKKFCKAGLRSPGTAKFVSTDIFNEDDSQCVATKLDGPYWYAHGKVDSHNAFGGLIRTDWGVVLEEKESDTFLRWIKIGDSEEGTFPEQHSRKADKRTVEEPTAPRPPTQAQLTMAAAVVAEQEKVKYLSQADTVALNWQIKRAADGNASALFDLGVRHLVGNGVEKDEALGKQMIKNAADQGYSYAIKKLKTLP